MKDSSNKTSWLLAAAIVILGIAVAAQSVAIYGLHRKLDAASTDKEKGQIEEEQAAEGEQADEAQTLQPTILAGEQWDPFKEMSLMRRRIDSMFGDAFDRFSHADPWMAMMDHYSFSPQIDMEDRGDHLLVTVDLPGNDKSQLKVNVKGQTLTLSGSINSQTRQEDEDGKILRQERRSGSFERVIMLPVPVEEEGMTTEEKDGVLNIRIPKAVSGPLI